MIKSIRDNNFDKYVSNEMTLLDFYSDTCSPCKKLEIILNKLSKEFENVKVFRIDVNKNPGLVTKYSVRGLPTLILMKNYKIVKSIVGSILYEQIKEILKQNTEIGMV